MGKAVTQNGIGIKEVKEFVNGDGWRCERIVYDVPHHDVQIVRCNGDDSAVSVKVDGSMALLPLKKADVYIRNRI